MHWPAIYCEQVDCVCCVCVCVCVYASHCPCESGRDEEEKVPGIWVERTHWTESKRRVNQLSLSLYFTQLNHLLFPLKQLILISLSHIEVAYFTFTSLFLFSFPLHHDCPSSETRGVFNFFSTCICTDASLTHLISLLILFRMSAVFRFSLVSLLVSPFFSFLSLSLSLSRSLPTLQGVSLC